MKATIAGSTRLLGIIAAVTSIWFCWYPLSSQADLLAKLSVQQSGNPGGGFIYEYLIENLPESTHTVSAFVLDVGTGADLQNVEGPEGWFSDFDPAEDPFEMVWMANSIQYAIPVGGQGTFRFTSPLDAELLPFFISDDSFENSVDGYIPSPGIPIPEPGTGGILLIAALAWMVMRWRHRI